MQVSPEDFVYGIMSYAETEFLPVLEVWQQVVAGAAIAWMRRFPQGAIEKIKGEKVVSALGIINKEGTIDLEAVVSSVLDSVKKYGQGKLTIDFGKTIGPYSFNEADLQKLKSYIARKGN